MTATTQPKAVVIYSGGMDSFTVLHQALTEGVQLYPLTFDYGQRHVKEITIAQKVCNALGLPIKVLNITTINQLMTRSSLTQTDRAIPEGSYATANMKSTVVPNRNMILLSLAIGYAVDIGAQTVYYGAHAGDHAIYPDCRPEFVQAINQVSAIANYEPVVIRAPFLELSKTDILKVGLGLGLDYSQTWTCYNGRERACGKCGACIERLKAFAENHTQDPLAYESNPGIHGSESLN